MNNEIPERKTLFLIPTVLAENTQFDVLSPDIQRVISSLDVFFVENFRTARRFISSLKLGIKIDDLELYELTKNTKRTEVYERMILQQKSMGVMSEAGCPGIADPGAVAVEIAHQLGWKVLPLVGPNSMILALMASGFSGQSFAFNGYLPIEKDKRVEEIKRLERLMLTKSQTQLFMETPFRNNQVMQSLLQHCSPTTRLCVAANVTAADAFIETKTIAEWKKRTPDLHKIPTIFLIGTVGNKT